MGAGGINFTASHNPPEYQGIKFSTADGAPVLPEITQRIEAIILENPTPSDKAGGSIENFDPRPAYIDDLQTKIRFGAIAAAGGRYVYDDPLLGDRPGGISTKPFAITNLRSKRCTIGET